MNAVVKVAPGHSARASVLYCFYGRGKQYFDNVENGTHRAVRYACTMDSPDEFIQYCNAHARGKNRRNELYSVILSVDPTVFDVDNPGHLDRVLRMGVRLAERAYDAEHMVIVHGDAKGGHAHAHILVANHDRTTGNAISRNRSWTHGLRQLSDELLLEEGLTPQAEPFRDKPGWSVRRQDFSEGSFERVLGDKIQAALNDPATRDRESFDRALGARGVELVESARDGWTFKMRRFDKATDGKLPPKGRRKASRLTSEFTADRVRGLWESRHKVARVEVVEPVVGPVVHQVTTAEIMRRAEARTAESIRRAEESRSRLLEELAVGTDSSLATSPIAHVKAGQPRVADSPVEADELPSRGSRGGGHGGKIREPEPVKPVSTPVPPSPISLTWGDVLADLPWLWEQYLQGHPDYRQEFGLFVSKRVGLVGSLQAVDMAGVFEEFMCEKPQVDEDYSQFVDKRWEVYSSRGGKVERRDVFENQTVRQREEAMQRVKTDIQRQVAGLRHPDVERGMSL